MCLVTTIGWVLFTGSAAAQAPGSTVILWESVFEAKTAGNASLTSADGDHWAAVEWVDPIDFMAPALSVVWYDPDTAGNQKKILQSLGSLTGDGMYPSILTWDGHSNVYLTGKKDGIGAGNLAHIRMHAQVRDNFTGGHSTTTLTAENPAEHSVPHLSWDAALPIRHITYTIKGTGDEHLHSKAKDASTWVNSTLREVSGSAEVEDHAMSDFTFSGRRYTVYHREYAAGTDICLEITTWDGTTWTTVSEFCLDGSEGMDFPSISIRSNATEAMIAIAAQHKATDEVALWQCGRAAETSCEEVDDFGTYDGCSRASVRRERPG